VNADFHERELPVGPPVDHEIAREELLAAAGFELSAERACLPHQYFLKCSVRDPPPVETAPAVTKPFLRRLQGCRKPPKEVAEAPFAAVPWLGGGFARNEGSAVRGGSRDFGIPSTRV